MATDQLMHLALVVSALWSIVCRLNLLQPGKTSALVAMQLIGMGGALMASLCVPQVHAAPVVLAGVCWFFGLGSGRWRHRAPEGVLATSAAPEPLADRARRYVRTAGAALKRAGRRLPRKGGR